MRTDLRAATALLFLASFASAADFELGRVANTTRSTPEYISIQVTTVGSPPAGSVLSDLTRWTAAIKTTLQRRQFVAVPLASAEYDDATGVITLKVSREKLAAVHPLEGTWRVSFQEAPDNVLDATQDPATPDDFVLGSASGLAAADEIRVRVRAPGIPPDGATVNNPDYWRVQVSDSSGNRKAIQPVKRAHYSYNSGFVTLSFPASQLGNIQPADASWTAAFLAPDTTLVSEAKSHGGRTLHQAKSRDDADLYLAGNYLAGVGTKPIWVLDAKAGYANAPEKFPLLRSLVSSSPPNLRFGIYGEMKTNLNEQPPTDRTRLDPDSILGYTSLFQTIRLQQNPFFYGIKWELQPIGGEFSRRYPVSTIVSGGRIRFVRVLAAEKRWGADLIPSLGFEGGKNLNKPGILFSRPVDLSNYDAIARLRTGAEANLYFYRRLLTEEDPYAFTVNASWTARTPFTNEPFTRSVYLQDPADPAMNTRQDIVMLRKNTRHYVQVDAVWNVTKLFGFQTEYKYGSLPPLFELVDHQVSVGLVFKAAYGHDRSMAPPRP